MPGLLERLLGRRPEGEEPPTPSDDTSSTEGAIAPEAPTQTVTAVAPPGAPDAPVLGGPFESADHEPVPQEEPPPAHGEPSAQHLPADVDPGQAVVPAPNWRHRGQMRRRLRFLRRAREIALRDLGGLMLDLHRFDRERPDLVTAKLEALSALDRERRSLEAALNDRREIDLLRVPGLATCPTCGTLHPSDAHYCSNCGTPLSPGAGAPAALNGPAPSEPETVPGAAAATVDAPGT
jgi:ribosomal protein L32